MTRFRMHQLSAVSVEQAGAWEEPTHWRIKRHGQLVCTSDNETDALTVGLALAQHGTDEWIALRRLAASMVGMDQRDTREEAA